MTISRTRGLALAATLAAASIASRVAFAGGPPNVKPVAFFAVIAGGLAGPVVGGLTGFASMLGSDAYFGIGPWTPVTSTTMAFVGTISGFLLYSRNVGRTKLAILGFALTAFYDITTSLYDVVIFNVPLWAALAGLYFPFFLGARVVYPFGFAHELTTGLLLYFAGPSLLQRFRLSSGSFTFNLQAGVKVANKKAEKEHAFM